MVFFHCSADFLTPQMLCWLNASFYKLRVKFFSPKTWHPAGLCKIKTKQGKKKKKPTQAFRNPPRRPLEPYAPEEQRGEWVAVANHETLST